jgi:hypothetical protein
MSQRQVTVDQSQRFHKPWVFKARKTCFRIGTFGYRSQLQTLNYNVEAGTFGMCTTFCFPVL